MGAGDRFLQPSFTVPMPAGAGEWPFPVKTRSYCDVCERPTTFCECGASPAREEKA